MSYFNIIISLLLIFNFSTDNKIIKIGNRINKGQIDSEEINEASGIDASPTQKGVLWVHNDSGDKSRLFALNESGQLLCEVIIKKAQNRDWEDLTVHYDSELKKSFIYIGEIGDNRAKYKSKYIYKIAEPAIDTGKRNQTKIVTEFEKYKFNLDNGVRDTETLMSDPIGNRLIIISKREDNVFVYQIPLNKLGRNNLKAEKIAILNNSNIVGGDISDDGSRIIIKDYMRIYFWERNSTEELKDLFKRKPINLPYRIEAQGEAICWADNGYFTLSEENRLVPEAYLYFYPEQK